jgi:hypothetical protein
VFIADADIAHRQHATLFAQLVEWVRGGGTAVIGGLLSSFIQLDKFDSFFAKKSWTRGNYHRTIFALNPHARPWLVPDTSPTMPKSYSMKAVHLQGVDPQDAVYVSTDDSQLESLVWAPSEISLSLVYLSPIQNSVKVLLDKRCQCGGRVDPGHRLHVPSLVPIWVQKKVFSSRETPSFVIMSKAVVVPFTANSIYTFVFGHRSLRSLVQ